MFKSIVFAAIAATTFFVGVSPAEAAKPSDCRARDNRIECYLDLDDHRESAQVSTQQTSTQQSGSGFREPNASPEQVALAINMSFAAFQQCQIAIRKDESARGWNRAGQQIGIAIANRLTRTYSYGGSNYDYPDQGRRESLQSCEQVRERVYSDMLRSTPSSYCDESMTTVRRRGGKSANEELMVQRCQARRSDSSWNTGFQPEN